MQVCANIRMYVCMYVCMFVCMNSEHIMADSDISAIGASNILLEWVNISDISLSCITYVIIRIWIRTYLKLKSKLIFSQQMLTRLEL